VGIARKKIVTRPISKAGSKNQSERANSEQKEWIKGGSIHRRTSSRVRHLHTSTQHPPIISPSLCIRNFNRANCRSLWTNSVCRGIAEGDTASSSCGIISPTNCETNGSRASALFRGLLSCKLGDIEEVQQEAAEPSLQADA